MTEIKYSNQELNDIIENEGLCYAITDYINPRDIEDPTTLDLWATAKTAIEYLETHLLQFGGTE